MSTLRLATIPLILVALAALISFLPANQARTQTAVTGLVSSFTAPAAVKSSEQAAEEIAAWIAANPSTSRPANKLYDVTINGVAVQLTTSQILMAAQQTATGGVKINTRLGTITATLTNLDKMTNKPPRQCRYMWAVEIPGVSSPVYVCADGLFDFIDRITEGSGPPALR